MFDSQDYVGVLHGVAVYFGESRQEFYPVADDSGTLRPRLQIERGCPRHELFKKVCHVRGRYDLGRALDKLAPFEWGDPGAWSDSHSFLSIQ